MGNSDGGAKTQKENRSISMSFWCERKNWNRTATATAGMIGPSAMSHFRYIWWVEKKKNIRVVHESECCIATSTHYIKLDTHLLMYYMIYIDNPRNTEK